MASSGCLGGLGLFFRTLFLVWTIGGSEQLCLAGDSRPITVADEIGIVRFGLDVNSPIGGSKIAHPVYSADGQSFAITTTRADPRRNDTVSTVWLFNTEDVEHSLQSFQPSVQPHELVTFRSSFSALFPNQRDVIANVRWLQGDRSLIFRARRPNGLYGLYTVDIGKGKLHELSPSHVDVASFDVQGERVAFLASQVAPEMELFQAGGDHLPALTVGTGKSLYDLLFPNWADQFAQRSDRLWTTRLDSRGARAERAALPELVHSVSSSGVLALSPAENSAVVAAFEDPRTTTSLRYQIVDIERGRSEVLLDGTLGHESGFYDALIARWTSDGEEVALSNVLLPSARRSQSTRVPCIVVFKVQTHSSECVKYGYSPSRSWAPVGEYLSDMQWEDMGNRLLLTYESESSGITLEMCQRNVRGWQCAPTLKSGTDQKLDVSILERYDIPPQLMAKAKGMTDAHAVWNPNPQLANLRYGRTSDFHWKDRNGRKWRGGLVLPVGYDGPGRCPLVIQTHGFDPNSFLSDGFYTTANAALALSARGIAVLQVAEIDAVPTSPRAAEENGWSGYLSAINALSTDGIIDPNRVGITGFSFTGWYVLEALEQAPGFFRTAVLSEVTHETIGEYLFSEDRAGQEDLSTAMGAKPFGEGLRKWFLHSPGFHIDRILAPVLFQENSPIALIWDWDIYATFRMLNKTVDLQYLRGAAHILNRPADLLASQGQVVDWYDFWLNGHEDPDPTKVAQYRRWEKLCEVQRTRNPDKPIFCVRSHSAH